MRFNCCFKGENQALQEHYEFSFENNEGLSYVYPNNVQIPGNCILQANVNVLLDDDFVPHESPVLDWNMRMRIAVGVTEVWFIYTRGQKVIHPDVMIENVLLDGAFVPKLTYFGLATKTVIDNHEAEMQSVINPIKGTLGCIAPEIDDFDLVSTDSDTYSFC
ncbi:unnamed protein product [Arabis nemorensis]|uniref:Protein kinase domain-containing protein n=1 Tax=Arabis nemorensis TaxID=586526 RepID=A0A565CSE5_9BRAS|nr:unnamed protein product [Arabis nemorensis]